LSKELLDKEKSYMDFVEYCSDNAFPDTDSLSDLLYYEKSLFLRICAGQQILKSLFFNGHKERLLNISQYGPQRFFLELVVIHLHVPLFLARVFLKIKFSATLFRLSLHWTSKRSVSDLATYENLTFLMSDFDRLTSRFTDVIRDAKHICEIHSDCEVRLISNGDHSYFFLPRLTIYQFLCVLRAPSWKMTYLIRAYRQYNFIEKYSINIVYSMDGDSPSSVSSAYAAHLADTISTCIQWGAMPMGIKPGYKLFPFNYFLCTGQYYVDLLSPFSDRTEFLASAFINNAKLDNKIDFNRCGSILFVLLDSVHSTVISKEESDFLINLCAETKRRFPDLNVTARPHPNMVLNEGFASLFKECGVVIDTATNPNIALSQNKFVVGQVSGLMIEAVEYDCFPIFMEIGIKQMYPDLIMLTAAMRFKTKKAWFRILDDLLENYSNYKTPVSLKQSLNNTSRFNDYE
jgi:hypothetical protein